jgi:hypothetical protein
MKTTCYAIAILIAAGTMISAFWALHEQQQRLTASHRPHRLLGPPRQLLYQRPHHRQPNALKAYAGRCLASARGHCRAWAWR